MFGLRILGSDFSVCGDMRFEFGYFVRFVYCCLVLLVIRLRLVLFCDSVVGTCAVIGLLQVRLGLVCSLLGFLLPSCFVFIYVVFICFLLGFCFCLRGFRVALCLVSV